MCKTAVGNEADAKRGVKRKKGSKAKAKALTVPDVAEEVPSLKVVKRKRRRVGGEEREDKPIVLEEHQLEEAKRSKGTKKKKSRRLRSETAGATTTESTDQALLDAIRRCQGIDDAPTQLQASPRNPKRASSRSSKARAEEAREGETKRERVEDLVAAPASSGGSEYRKLHEIVVDAACPAPFETFEAAEVAFGPALASALRAQGFLAPTPIQAQAWPLAVAGEDIVGVAKTGSGKTCGYLLPALCRIGARGATQLQPGTRKVARPGVLVLAPTRELVLQIFEEAQKFGKAVAARAVAIYGGAPKGDQVRELQAGADIIICTPGRLLDFMAGDPTRDLPPSITVEAVTYLVLDEADRMLDMGFGADIKRVVEKCPESGTSAQVLAGNARQTSFFTATWPKEVQKAGAAFTRQNAMQIRIGQGVSGKRLTANEDVTQTVLVIQESEKLQRLKEILRSVLQPGETAIVFAMRKKTCQWVQEELAWDNGPSDPPVCEWCRPIHGDKEQWEREEALGQFREMTEKAGTQKAVLVATDVAARGLDIPGVSLVVIYDFSDPVLGPDTGVESYVHKIGRTGRAGKPGKAITLFTQSDSAPHRFAALLRDAKQEIPPALAELALAAKEKKAGKASGGKGKMKGKGKGKGKSKGKSGGGKGKGKW